jgi:cell shape-determining protein MreC
VRTHDSVLFQLEDREQQLQALGRANSSKLGKRDLKRFGAQVKDKIEKYKRMREEIAALRAELATLQRTEQILKGKHQHLDAFLSELERKRGVEV